MILAFFRGLVLKERHNIRKGNALSPNNYPLFKVKTVISGLTLNRTCHKCSNARLMYSRRPSSRSISPEVYFLFFTGNIGGSKQFLTCDIK